MFSSGQARLRGALTQSRSCPGLSREAIGQPVRRDLDSLESAAGRALVELRTGAAFEHAGDQAGERFTDNQTEGIAVLVPADQGLECRLDPIDGVGDGLALRRADGSWILDPLAEQLGVAPLDLLDLQTLPETLIEVSQLIDPSGRRPKALPTISAVRMTLSPGPQ